MENNSQPKSKSKYVSTEQLIMQMKIAFANAKLPTILPQLQTLGYTEEKLNEYLEKVSELENLSQVQKKEYGEQYAETEKMNKNIPKKEKSNNLEKNCWIFLCKFYRKTEHFTNVPN